MMIVTFLSEATLNFVDKVLNGRKSPSLSLI